jgi:hypothetical protein
LAVRRRQPKRSRLWFNDGSRIRCDLSEQIGCGLMIFCLCRIALISKPACRDTLTHRQRAEHRRTLLLRVRPSHTCPVECSCGRKRSRCCPPPVGAGITRTANGIGAQSTATGASPTVTCQIHGVSSGQLYTWRKQFRSDALTGFLPVSIALIRRHCLHWWRLLRWRPNHAPLAWAKPSASLQSVKPITIGRAANEADRCGGLLPEYLPREEVYFGGPNSFMQSKPRSPVRLRTNAKRFGVTKLCPSSPILNPG